MDRRRLRKKEREGVMERDRERGEVVKIDIRIELNK